MADHHHTRSGRLDPDSSAHRSLPALIVAKTSVGPMDNNAYLLTDRHTGDALLIDAANEAPRLLEWIDSRCGRGRLVATVTTHRHADHWQALAAVVEATGATVIAGAADAAGLPIPVDRQVGDGDQIRLGQTTLSVIALRGHTPGSIAVSYHDPIGSAHIFTGDSLFPGGPGKTASPADFTSLMDDLQTRVFDAFDDDTWIYPGHGADTTIGAERPHLAEWRTRGW